MMLHILRKVYSVFAEARNIGSCCSANYLFFFYKVLELYIVCLNAVQKRRYRQCGREQLVEDLNIRRPSVQGYVARSSYY